MMKRTLVILIALSFSLLSVAGVGDKAGGSKDVLMLKAMSVSFAGAKIPIFETCLNRDNDIQTINPIKPSNKFLTTSRHYIERVCLDTDRDGCVEYGPIEKEYPLQYRVRKYKNSGRLRGRDRNDDIRYLGSEKRRMKYCEEI